MMSGTPNIGQYPLKTARLSGARYHLALATSKDPQCAFTAQKSALLALQSARKGRQITPRFGGEIAVHDESGIVIKLRDVRFRQ